MKEMYNEKAFQIFIEGLVLDTDKLFTKSKKDLMIKTVERWDKEDSKERL